MMILWQANYQEPNFQKEFWGANYKRLCVPPILRFVANYLQNLTKNSQSIKRAVDPDDVLWCTPCVGNERWEQVGDQLCRVNGGH